MGVNDISIFQCVAFIGAIWTNVVVFHQLNFRLFKIDYGGKLQKYENVYSSVHFNIKDNSVYNSLFIFVINETIIVTNR